MSVFIRIQNHIARVAKFTALIAAVFALSACQNGLRNANVTPQDTDITVIHSPAPASVDAPTLPPLPNESQASGEALATETPSIDDSDPLDLDQSPIDSENLLLSQSGSGAQPTSDPAAESNVLPKSIALPANTNTSDARSLRIGGIAVALSGLFALGVAKRSRKR